MYTQRNPFIPGTITYLCGGGWVAGMRAIAEGSFENNWHTFSKVKFPGKWNYSGELLCDWCLCSFANCRLSS